MFYLPEFSGFSFYYYYYCAVFRKCVYNEIKCCVIVGTCPA